MSRLPRPYIPLEVRCRAALRQINALNIGFRYDIEKKIISAHHLAGGEGHGKLLKNLLWHISLAHHCAASDLHLDHDPALCNRRLNKRTGRYTPDANDPDHLVYRTKDDHGIKTRVRGENGQYSDLALMKRERRRLRKEKPRRAWPTGRKMQSRGFRR